MKKVIALVIMLALAGTGSVFAVNGFYLAAGGVGILGGGGVLGMTIGLGIDMPGDIPLLVGGGGLVICGIVFLVKGFVSPSPSSRFAQAVEENPVLRHVSLDFAPDSVTVGFRKKF